MKVTVYVDGQNLYYGLLKGCNLGLKWLNLYSLFHQLIETYSDVPFSSLFVKYYTSDILQSYSKHKDSVEAQDKYNRALYHANGEDKIEIIKGKYIAECKFEKLCENQKEMIKVVKIEEKKTDVKIGIGMYRDALQQHCDAIVLCSNDSDLVPAVEAIRNDFKEIKLAVTLPNKEKGDSNRSSNQLGSQHNWFFKEKIEKSLLESNQLPTKVSYKKSGGRRTKTICKPERW